MNNSEWVTFLHPFDCVGEKMKKLLIKLLYEIRNIIVVMLGLDSLVYRISQSNNVLGKDVELIEDLFTNINNCLNFVFSAHFCKLFSIVEIIAFSVLSKFIKQESAIDLV